MPADAPADAGEPLRRTTADAKNHQKMAADAFPAFEKYKVIESNPPCGCPMGCVAHCMGRGFSAVSSPSLSDAFVLRSSLTKIVASGNVCALYNAFSDLVNFWKV